MNLKTVVLYAPLALIGCASTPEIEPTESPGIEPVEIPVVEADPVQTETPPAQSEPEIFSYEELKDPRTNREVVLAWGKYLSTVKSEKVYSCKSKECLGEDRSLNYTYTYDQSGRHTKTATPETNPFGGSLNLYEYLGDAKYPIRQIKTDLSGDPEIIWTYDRDSHGNVNSIHEHDLDLDSKRVRKIDWSRVPGGYLNKGESTVREYVNGFQVSFEWPDDRRYDTYHYEYDSDGNRVVKNESITQPSFLSLEDDSTTIAKYTYDSSGRILTKESSVSFPRDGGVGGSFEKTLFTYVNDSKGNWIFKTECTEQTNMRNGQKDGDTTEECVFRRRAFEYY